MDNKLFVGNLSWGTTEESLKEFFSKAGEVVEAKIIIDRQSGKSKGFAFVTMADAAGAQKAIAELNNQDLDGRPVRVSEARPPKEKSDFRR